MAIRRLLAPRKKIDLVAVLTLTEESLRTCA